jgi:type IV pilus assembly protein PilE
MKIRQRGVTIIELLIAMVIIAVLVAIALPAYQSQLRKGSRAAAQALLVNIANRQAQYLLDARNYAVGPAALGALNVVLPTEVAAYYTVVIENASGGATPSTPASFTVKATPLAGSRQETDGALMLTHDGSKTRGSNPGW